MDGVDKSNIKGSISIKPPVTDSVKESKADSSDIIKAIQMQTSAIVNSIQQLATALMNKDGGGGKGIDDVLDRNLLNIMNELSILRTGNI
jgi:predicted component of type VI protein secretion system